MDLASRVKAALGQLEHDLTNFPPVTEQTKKQITDDAKELAMNYGPMGLTIKTSHALTYPKNLAQEVKVGEKQALSLKELWQKYKLLKFPSPNTGNTEHVFGWIDDSAAKLKDPNVIDWLPSYSHKDFNEVIKELKGVDGSHSSRKPLLLKDVLDHPELYDEYSKLNLENTRVFAIPGSGGYFMPNKYLGYTHSPGAIAVGYKQNPEQALEALLHEATHAIQSDSKFTRPWLGATPENYVNYGYANPAWAANATDRQLQYIENFYNRKGIDAARIYNKEGASGLHNGVMGLPLRLAQRYKDLAVARYGFLTTSPAVRQRSFELLADELYRANPGEVTARLPGYMLEAIKAGRSDLSPYGVMQAKGWPYQTWDFRGL